MIESLLTGAATVALGILLAWAVFAVLALVFGERIARWLARQ